jgi:hypothetical protein
MDLLLFYINQVFGSFHLPLPAEICSNSESLKPMCLATTGFTLFFVVFAIVVTAIVFRKKLTNNYALILFSIFRVIACFFFADYILKQIQEPAIYGLEWFVVLYYFWCFAILNIFLSLILLPSNSKQLLSAALILTLILIPLFAYFGRGNFEQITPIAGGLFAKINFRMLMLSFSFKLFLALAAIALISAFVAFLGYWTIHGKFRLGFFTRNFILTILFFIILILPVSSVFLGEYFNRKDIAESKNYIEAIKTRVDKYYYENGEYPKFIEDMLPKGSSPRLLDRQEFFTQGIKGTYYFSRSDKYCMLFQNPTRKFGYYSITSERDWRYAENAGSYDDVFINLCDESNKNFEDLISSHLGVNDKDKIINAISADIGAAIIPAESKKAGSVLEEKVREDSKKDPTLLKYLQQEKQ